MNRTAAIAVPTRGHLIARIAALTVLGGLVMSRGTSPSMSFADAGPEATTDHAVSTSAIAGGRDTGQWDEETKAD